MGSTHAGAVQRGRLTDGQVFLFAFAYNFSTAVLVVSLPLRALTLGANSVHLGVTGGIWSLSLIFFAVWCGRLSDRVGQDRLMALGPLVCGLATLSTLSIPKLEWLFVVSALMGLGSALFWPAMEAKVAEGADDEELGRHLSRFNVAWSSGNASGTFLTGILLGRSASLPFCVASAALLLLTIRLAHLYVLRKKAERGAEPPVRAEAQTPREETVAFLYMARLANFAVAFSVASIRWLFPKLAVTLGMTEAMIGVLLGMLLGGQALAFLAMGWIRRWQYAFGAVLAALILPLLGLALAWSGTNAMGFGAAFFAIGLGGGMAFTLSLFYSVHGSPARGSNAGLHEAIMGCGAMLGPLLGGVVARQVALRATNLLNTALIAFTLVWISIFWYSLPCRQRKEYSGTIRPRADAAGDGAG